MHIIKVDQKVEQAQCSSDQEGGQASAVQISSRHRLSSSERSSISAENNVAVISCPNVNCPEKIVSTPFPVPPQIENIYCRFGKVERFIYKYTYS